jgi:hypothetical protein
MEEDNIGVFVAQTLIDGSDFLAGTAPEKKKNEVGSEQRPQIQRMKPGSKTYHVAEKSTTTCGWRNTKGGGTGVREKSPKRGHDERVATHQLAAVLSQMLGIIILSVNVNDRHSVVMCLKSQKVK